MELEVVDVPDVQVQESVEGVFLDNEMVDAFQPGSDGGGPQLVEGSGLEDDPLGTDHLEPKLRVGQTGEGTAFHRQGAHVRQSHQVQEGEVAGETIGGEHYFPWSGDLQLCQVPGKCVGRDVQLLLKHTENTYLQQIQNYRINGRDNNIVVYFFTVPLM